MTGNTALTRRRHVDFGRVTRAACPPAHDG